MKIPHELGGRSLTLRVFPLRFWEYLKFRGETIDAEAVKYSDTEMSKLLRLFEDYLAFGGLPEVAISPAGKKVMTLQDYFNAIVLRDILEAKGGARDVSKVLALMKVLVNSLYFSASKLERVMESAGYRISRDMILEYGELAKDAFFIETVPQLSNSLKRQITAPSKIYVGDNGFITALSRRRVRKGRLLENLVFIELMRRYYGDPSVEISYWAGREGEVDFVVRAGFGIAELIQVCWDPTDYDVREREIKPLVRLMRATGLRRARVITGYHEEVARASGREVVFVPYWKWEMSGKKSPHVL